MLLGILADKDARGIVEALAPVAGAIAVAVSSSPRALPADKLAAIVAEVTGVAPATYESVALALAALLGDDDGSRCAEPLLVTGSITMAGEARTLLRDGSATASGPHA